MALPNARQNLVGCQVSNSDLGLTVVASANLTTQTSNTITDDVPRTIIVLADLVSGSVKIELDRAASGAPAFSSPQATYTLVNNASSGIIKMDTTSSALNWAVKVTSSSGLLSSFAVLDLAKLGTGEEWVNVTSGQNSVASSVTGDGSGVFSIAVV